MSIPCYVISSLGVRTQVTSDMRGINQRLIREQIAGLAALYHFNPEQ